MEVEDTLAYLAGVWQLEREFLDHRTGASGTFVGEGIVRAAGDKWHYREEGRLRLDGYHGTAQRALDLIAIDDRIVHVRFTDGRPFYELGLRTGSCLVVHPCRPDVYRLKFEACSPELLLEHWEVHGPTKDYEAHTTWRRRSESMPRTG